MPVTPEDCARETIDRLLTAAGWTVQDRKAANLATARGVAVGEFPLKPGHGEADYLLFVDGSPIGVVEAKREGSTLTGVELQTTEYSEGVPDQLKAPRRPLPFQYQSTGVETRFTNLLEPDACSRPVFAFHRPETLAEWLTPELQHPGSSLRARLRHMPELLTEGLRPAQTKAIRNLERSLAESRPRALIQMASGGGKTYTARNFSYRLIKHAGARRILFLSTAATSVAKPSRSSKPSARRRRTASSPSSTTSSTCSPTTWTTSAGSASPRSNGSIPC